MMNRITPSVEHSFRGTCSQTNDKETFIFHELVGKITLYAFFSREKKDKL